MIYLFYNLLLLHYLFLVNDLSNWELFTIQNHSTFFGSFGALQSILFYFYMVSFLDLTLFNQIDSSSHSQSFRRPVLTSMLVRGRPPIEYEIVDRV